MTFFASYLVELENGQQAKARVPVINGDRAKADKGAEQLARKFAALPLLINAVCLGVLYADDTLEGREAVCQMQAALKAAGITKDEKWIRPQ